MLNNQEFLKLVIISFLLMKIMLDLESILWEETR